jgi:hypothetical protein
MRNADSSDYPLLGPRQMRLLVVLPTTAASLSTDAIIARMQQVGARYAYVTVEDESLAAQVERQFDPLRFEISSYSTVGVVDPRCCFEVRAPGAKVRRYLFHLVA